ncbi:VWA domain-containing protein [Streptomyces sp. RFCAC02]|uniref:vWA domain-containing protein n=1 Tax=Streptomyces sp. RFCAC02 TaxID=2499143 RepID=UPI001021A225|nr:VWA domain-containing protein [Streptomyces sp. RFCAC02]
MAATGHGQPFGVEVFQNEYLPEGAHEVNAVVTVTATGGAAGAAAGTGPPAAVVILLDTSGSMAYPETKLRYAREATAAAIGTLPDGVAFAVVAGTHRATEIYPGGGALAVAGAGTRAGATAALRRLTADGGTAIGTWLTLAARLLGTTTAPVRHAILLTDGRNEHESPDDLSAALTACAGLLTCDARGVGTDWEVAEVTGIADALLGTADIVAGPEGLARDFTAMMTAATGKETGDVALRVWTPRGASVRFLKQVAPSVSDLTGRRADVPPRAGDYPTGSWGADESRDYHLCVDVPAAAIGEEMLAARVSLVLRDPAAPAGPPATVLGQGLVRAVWTDDVTATTGINPHVAHYTGQAELAEQIREGLRLRAAGDVFGATARLGRAVRLAHASGNEATAKLLAAVVDVEDAATGTVRLKTAVSRTDEMTLATRSTRSVRVKKKSHDAREEAEPSSEAE